MTKRNQQQAFYAVQQAIVNQARLKAHDGVVYLFKDLELALDRLGMKVSDFALPVTRTKTINVFNELRDLAIERGTVLLAEKMAQELVDKNEAQPDEKRA